MLLKNLNKEEIISIPTAFFQTYTDLKSKLIMIGKTKIRVIVR